MITSGELFLLNGDTGGELRPLPQFLNQNICVIAANADRAYVACEPPVCPPQLSKRPCSVWCFQGRSGEPVRCPEFDAIDDTIRQIAIGEKHLLVLTQRGAVYSRGAAVYGNAGHGGARQVPEFRPVPALKDRRVKFVAAGPYFSVAITHEGDVFSWGQAFNGETGLFGQVEAVPRFAPEVTKLRVTEVSCGHSHVLARTETQQCVSWGENTCGQLGLGQKSKPTYKPQVLSSIPSQVQNVSAGWAHSVAVGGDGRVYSWGLNSHGQLGLGDTATKPAPHLLHNLVGQHRIDSAQAARTLTVLFAADCRVLLCGQIPCAADATLSAEFHPRRPGEVDPEGCLLVPMPISLAGAGSRGGSHSQLTQVIGFDKGALGVARSTVYRVSPNLAPLQGGTLVRARVTGLPFEPPGRRADPEARPVQELVPLRVRLSAAGPACDVMVPGRIVDAETVEFTTPSVAGTPLGAVVEQGFTSAVQLRVSIDDGFTWTPDRHSVPTAEELDQTSLQNGGPKSMQKGLQDLKEDFHASRRVQDAIAKGATVLWYCRWPEGGPSHVEPGCAPVAGGTELLLHVQLPQQMPTDHLTVKFVCDPLHSVGDPELESRAPMRRDAAEIINPSHEEIAKLPLAGQLEVPVCAWLDPGGRGVRCVSPPFDAESVRLYRYFVQLSLDGCVFLERMLPFAVFDLRVTGLEPSIGPLLEQTHVKVRATGVVETDILRVRVDFPTDLGWDSRVLPASLDHTTGEISFMMPDLAVEVRRRADEAHATGLATAALHAPAAADDGATGAVELPPPEPDGGLHGVEVCVELSLNGQNFTEDRMYFTYYGPLEAEQVQLLSLPEGAAAEAPKEDAKAKKGGKGAVEEPAYTLVRPGSKLGCPLRPLLESAASAALRVELMSKVGDEEPAPLQTLTMPGRIELVSPPPPPPADPDPKAAKSAAPSEPAVELDPVEMLTALAPEVGAEGLPEGAVLLLCNWAVSLNGQSFAACQAQPPMRLEPSLPEPGSG